MANQVTFNFTTTIGDTYRVDARWGNSEQGISWEAMIFKADNFVGVQRDEYRGPSFFDIGTLVKKQIQVNLEAGILST